MNLRYSINEIRALIESYAELVERKGVAGRGLVILCKLADLDRAIAMLPPKEYQAVLLHGLLTYALRDVETLLGISKSTLHDRYEKGLTLLAKYLNEGEE